MKELILTIISAVLAIITPYIVKYIQAKITDTRIESAMVMVTEIVISVTQTYVDEMRKIDNWNEHTKMEAFNRAKTTALQLITPKLQNAIDKVYGDVNLWLDTVIESSVKLTK